MLPRNRFLRSPEGVVVTAVLLLCALYYLTHEPGALSWRVREDLPDGGVLLLSPHQGHPLQQPSYGATAPRSTASLNYVTQFTTSVLQNYSSFWPCGVNPSNVSHLFDVANFSMRCDVASAANNVAEELGNLILDLTQIQRVDYMRHLRQQLCGASKSVLEALWLQLSNFESKYACEGCSDPRPPPRTALPSSARLPLSRETWNGTSLPLLAVQPGGRLGNQMGEYATALALHKIYNVPIFLTAEMHVELSTAFPNISFPALPPNATAAGNWTVLGKDGGCAVRRYRGLELAAAGFFGPHRFVMAGYPIEMQLFNAYRRKILKEFTFRPDIVAKAKARLRNFTQSAAAAAPGQRSPLVKVGIHVRLSDYPDFMQREFRVSGLLRAYHGYLRRAVAYFQRRHSNVVYVVTSDDVYNTSLIFDSIGTPNVFVSNGSAPEDLCLLTLCRHTIVTFGTFGFWAGYLGGGTTLYPHLQYPRAQHMLTRDRYRAARVPGFVPLPFYAR